MTYFGYFIFTIFENALSAFEKIDAYFYSDSWIVELSSYNVATHYKTATL